MRHLIAAAAASALALFTVRCGSSPAGTAAVAPPADAGGGNSPDAGPPADGGGGSPIDAGGAQGADGGGSTADAGADGGTVASECDGLMPDPGAKSLWITPPSSACGTQATSDYAGNIALGARGPALDTTWATYDPQGNRLGSFASLGRIIPRDSGFQHVGVGDGPDTPVWKMWARAPDGTQSSIYTVGSDVCGASIYPAATGGSIVLSICGSFTGTTGVFRFDDAGTPLYRTAVAAYPFVGPAEGDAKGAILLVARGDAVAGFQSTEMLGRWLNPDGTFVTDWIVLTNDDNSPMSLRALIGGGIAVRQSEQWRMLVPTGREPDQPPEWLAGRAGTDLHVVRGNKGYAFTSNGGGEEVEVVTPSGKSCGKFNAGGSLVQIGGDGTVIGVSGTCKRTVWPRLLGVK